MEKGTVGNSRGDMGCFPKRLLGTLAPAVVLSGIYGGIFTATDAAIVAVFYWKIESNQ